MKENKSHVFNAVFVGENPLNFNDWYFIESQEEQEHYHSLNVKLVGDNALDFDDWYYTESQNDEKYGNKEDKK